MQTSASTGEVALWRAVVHQAIADATFGMRHAAAASGKRPRSCTPSREHLRLMGEARSWLLGGGRDFREVCVHAALEPSAVQAAVRRAIEAFDQRFPELRVGRQPSVAVMAGAMYSEYSTRMCSEMP